MNIKKFDIETYYKNLENFTSKEDIEESFLCRTKNYEFKYINYIIPKNVYKKIDENIDLFIKNNKEFKINEIENLISDYTFSIYKKKVAAKKIALLFINFKILDNKIKTENGFNFVSI